MPLQQCENNGWQWGNSGKCYTGPDARKNALKQGAVIEIQKHAKGEEIDLSEIGELSVQDFNQCYSEAGVSLDTDTLSQLTLKFIVAGGNL